VAARLARASLLADHGDAGAAMADVLAGLAGLAGLAHEPDNAHLLCLKGRLLAEQGDTTAARQVLSAALAADPGRSRDSTVRSTSAATHRRCATTVPSSTRRRAAP